MKTAKVYYYKNRNIRKLWTNRFNTGFNFYCITDANGNISNINFGNDFKKQSKHRRGQ